MSTPSRPREPDWPGPDDDHDEPPLSTVFRDFIGFEIKLFVDGLKDLVLAQGAVIAMILAVLRRRNRGYFFYRLMRLGQRFEEWLGLYGSVDDDDEDAPFGGANRALREAERRIRSRRRRPEEP